MSAADINQLILSTSYTMTRTPDLLPGTLDLLILRTLQKDTRHGWAISDRIQQNAIGRVMTLA